jgi:hypothetical protein
MPSNERERRYGNLSSGFIMDVLRVRAAYSTTDERLGQGYFMDFGTKDTAIRLTVFEQARALVIQSEGFQAKFKGIQRVSGQGQDLRFEILHDHERLNVDVYGDGTYGIRKLPFNQVNQGGVETRQGLKESHPTEPHPDDERERVTLVGRVGREPTFRTTTRRGVFIGQFPLGVHPDVETTVWHTIVMFDNRARMLQEKNLAVGEEIEVVGFPHKREIQTPTGEKKTVTEIYATAIRSILITPENDS